MAELIFFGSEATRIIAIGEVRERERVFVVLATPANLPRMSFSRVFVGGFGIRMMMLSVLTDVQHVLANSDW